MEYAEYKKILDEAIVDYVNNGGSVFYMVRATKEYIFTYENEELPCKYKENLNSKAVQAITNRQKLPSGIRLEKCIYHDTQKG